VDDKLAEGRETEGALRVWWIPQVPGTPFYVTVETPDEAAHVLDLRARYDQFQLDQNIKPDYCNAGGLEAFEAGEWLEWCDDDGEEIASLRGAR